MKVVLFCGGLGTRLRPSSGTSPKPLVEIGTRPILWHLMRYYGHFGHTEFILCLGYRGVMIREFFADYREWVSSDFTLRGDGEIELHSEVLRDWSITFVDTGLHAMIGERLRSARRFVEGEEYFLANYSDGLSDLDLRAHVDAARKSGSVARFVAVRPNQSLHAVRVDGDETVRELVPMGDSGLLINGGFFVFSHRIFDYIREGEDLVDGPFQRLIAEGKLTATRHDGFWAPIDTYKDKVAFDRMYARGERPWEVWNHDRGREGR